MRQTCTLMCLAALVLLMVPVRAGLLLREGAPSGAAGDLWMLLVAVALASVATAGLAVPVRRAVRGLWRAAQGVAVFALAASVGALYTAAQLADTLMLGAGLAGALLAISVNIALWSTDVMDWCDTVG